MEGKEGTGKWERRRSRRKVGRRRKGTALVAVALIPAGCYRKGTPGWMVAMEGITLQT